jgi:hypothetical protein
MSPMTIYPFIVVMILVPFDYWIVNSTQRLGCPFCFLLLQPHPLGPIELWLAKNPKDKDPIDFFDRHSRIRLTAYG